MRVGEFRGRGWARPQRRRGVRTLLLMALLVAAPSVTNAMPTVQGAPLATQVDVPPGFTQTLVASGLAKPTVIAFAPNGDIWIGEQSGAIVVSHNGVIQSNPVVTLKVDATIERGLLGLAFDPNFASNGFIYVSYVTATDFSQVSRLTVVKGTASLASERILVRGNQSQGPNGPGNGLKVGPDGKLWWSTGDNPPAWSNAQSLTNIYGKIIRLNLDGTAPADNPFVNVPGAQPGIYAYGLRNPFRFSFLPGGGLMTTDTGSSYWEELNTIQPGGNYGWPFYEGNCFSCGSINPAYAYGHLPQDGAISAVAAYTGATFPAAYRHVVFIGDYNRRDIEAVTFDPAYRTALSTAVFDVNAGSIADLEQGPDGNLYFVGIFEGKLWKISAPGPFPPSATASANPGAGTAPLSVQLSSAGSSEPYGRPLAYSWNFGDGSPVVAAPNPSHVYASNGTYTATLTVTSAGGTSSGTTTVVVGRRPPAVTIDSPVAASTYTGGATVSFRGTATDAVDGTLPASAFTWQVDFLSNGVVQPSYVHEARQPFAGPFASVTAGSVRIPTDPSNRPGTSYRITLRAVNSAGVASVATRDIQPALSSFTVTSSVAGGGYFIDGSWHTSTSTTNDVVGIRHVLSALPTETLGGQRYRLSGWASGGVLTDSFATAASPTTHTVNFEAAPTGPPAPWTSVDVGAPIMAGTADYAASSGTFYVDGGGADMFGAADQFHYVYRTLTGDGSIVARVRYQTDSSDWTKSGVMVKQAAASGSPYIADLVTPDASPSRPNINGVNCVFPSTAPGAGCDAPLPPIIPTVGHGIRVEYNAKGSMSVTTVPAGFVSPNKWLKLQRTGDLLTAFYSTDGVTWARIGATTIAMTNPVTIGLFVCSHNIRQTSSVAFDHVQLTGAVS